MKYPIPLTNRDKVLLWAVFCHAINGFIAEVGYAPPVYADAVFLDLLDKGLWGKVLAKVAKDIEGAYTDLRRELKAQEEVEDKLAQRKK